ncbi:MAG: pyruvate dehydrogenase, partial [Chitinophagia bacterium]|nr:pyruvate dehydrogenase [Chitinophagia bacterium]
MAEAIRLPLLSDTMTEGKIVAWNKKIGDLVKSDDAIAEVETDKATMEVLPPTDGTLLYIAANVGESVPVNGIIAIIGKPGDDFEHLLPTNISPTVTATVEVAPLPVAPAIVAEAPNVILPLPSSTITDAKTVEMPLLSDTMTEGKIVAWHKKIGDTLKSDDIIAEVETDKATMEIMPYVDGTLLYIGVEEGQAAKVNQIIAIIGKPGTDITPLLHPASAPVATNSTIPTDAPDAPATTPIADAGSAHDDLGRVKISPLARMLAESKHIDLRTLVGTGDGGRIVKRDIENYVPPATVVPPAPITMPAQAIQAPVASEPIRNVELPVMASATATLPDAVHTDIPVTQMRKIIAQRLSDSMFNAPHFYLTMQIAMDNLLQGRKDINKTSAVKISVNDMILKCCAMALQKHPQVNSSWMGDFIRQNHNINIGMAVAIPDGLVVPVIKNANKKSLSEIATDATE